MIGEMCAFNLLNYNQNTKTWIFEIEPDEDEISDGDEAIWFDFNHAEYTEFEINGSSCVDLVIKSFLITFMAAHSWSFLTLRITI